MINIPKFYNQGSQISRNLINSSITNLFHLTILSQHKQFVTDVKYYQKSIFSILTPTRTDLVSYILEHGYYVLNLSYNIYDLDAFSTFENIVELYNISRNETYQLLSKDVSIQNFLQPNEFVDIIKDVETSLYRITGFLSKTTVFNNINFNVSSSYVSKYTNSLYLLKNLGDKEFSVYELELSENNIISDIDTIFKIIQATEDEDIDLQLTDLLGIIKKDNVLLDNGDQTVINDITITVTYKEADGNDYLSYLNLGDILYFYVNRAKISQHSHDLQYELKDTAIVRTDQVNLFQLSNGSINVVTAIDNGLQVVDWNLSNFQEITLTTDVELLFNCSNNFSAYYNLKIIQGTEGSKSITFLDTNIKWVNKTPPTITQQQNSIDILKIFYDGSFYYCEMLNNF